MSNITLTAAVLVVIIMSVLSASLTIQSANFIGSGMGMARTIVAFGVAIELGKFVLPLLLFYHWGEQNTASIIMCFALLISCMCISFGASYSSIERSVTASANGSAAFQSINRQIETTQELYERQVSVNQLTKASHTQDKIDNLRKQLVDVKPTSSFVKYGFEVNVLLSIIIEIFSPIILFLISTLINTPKNGKNSNVPDCSERVMTRVRSVSTTETESITMTLEEQIVGAILSGEVRPSTRGVRAKYNGFSNEWIGDLLKGMLSDGLLRSNGRGYELVN